MPFLGLTSERETAFDASSDRARQRAKRGPTRSLSSTVSLAHLAMSSRMAGKVAPWRQISNCPVAPVSSSALQTSNSGFRVLATKTAPAYRTNSADRSRLD